MSTRTVDARWQGGYQVAVTAGRFRILVDEPESVGGTDTAPQPTDYLLAAVASCFALALVHSARKGGEEPAAVRVSVTGTYEGTRYSEIAIEIFSSLSDEQAERLVEAARRVCYVTRTLREPPRITIRHAPG
ncbi:OsmC family protein [Nonomuraea lactucae]|uniref:OsmC family protein n=1 Tax=Nonomuraea lactucae TaxID=2249762 RepID=UPI000DE26DD0|nr:OsmC family protein [Nonomuraea lactucae]